MAPGFGNANPVDVASVEDILRLEEGSRIVIRGGNKVYDNSMMQFSFYNQTNVVQIDALTSYIKSLETDVNEQKHIFDTFMDSIEINGLRRDSVKSAINGYIQAMQDGTKDVYKCLEMAFPLPRE